MSEKYDGPAIPPLGIVGLALFRSILNEMRPGARLRVINAAAALLATPGANNISESGGDRDQAIQARVLFEELLVTLLRKP